MNCLCKEDNEAPGWTQLKLPGQAPAARCGHTVTSGGHYVSLLFFKFQLLLTLLLLLFKKNISFSASHVWRPWNRWLVESLWCLLQWLCCFRQGWVSVSHFHIRFKKNSLCSFVIFFLLCVVLLCFIISVCAVETCKCVLLPIWLYLLCTNITCFLWFTNIFLSFDHFVLLRHKNF